MEYTQKRLVELLEVSHVALVKALKETPYTLKEVEESTKKVKHYSYDDLPERFRAKLPKPIEKPDTKPPNILNAKTKNFTKKYLLAKPQKQQEAVLKVRLVEHYLKRDSALNQQQWLQRTLESEIEFDVLGDVSVKQLCDWLRKYKEAKAKGMSVVDAFVDGRGLKNNHTVLNEEQQKMAIRYFLNSSHPVISKIHELMCERYGQTMPSYDTLNNFYKRWKRANPQLHLFALSPDKWKSRYQVAVGDESAKALYRNHYWELDATPADVMCSDGKRYTILGLIDVATRRSIFRVEDSNSKFAVSRLLRDGILRFGVPENVVIDNGKEFLSNHFESVCSNLDIAITITPPFSGEKKPFIERVFGTLARGLFRGLHGFIGHNQAMREEIQARQSFGHKIMSIKKAHREVSEDELDAFAKLWMIRKENVGIKLEFALSKEELQEAIDQWNTKYYEQKKHGGLGKTPMDAWNSYTTPVRGIADISMLDLLLGESFTRRVGKKGIALEGCTYMHDALLPYIGKHVKVMTRDEMGEVIVYDMENMRLICKAVDYEHMGKSREAAARLRKKQNRLKRALHKAVRESEEANDPNIIETLKQKLEVEQAQTIATSKHTGVTSMLLEESGRLAAYDQEELESSNTYDFSKKNEDGRPVKVLEGGRPAFETFVDRFVWLLEHPEMINEKDEKLKEKRPESWDMAQKIIEERKLA